MKIGNIGMSDDLIHDTVEISNPDFNMGNVKPKSYINMFNTDSCAAHYKGW